MEVLELHSSQAGQQCGVFIWSLGKLVGSFHHFNHHFNWFIGCYCNLVENKVNWDFFLNL